MKATFKTTLFLLICSLACLYVGSCKKESAQKKAAQTDFRDSLAGNYLCTYITSYSNPNGSGADTNTINISVAKCPGTDSAILLSGDTFRYGGMVSGTQAYLFNGPVSNPISCINQAIFPPDGASIYSTSGCRGASSGSSATAQGHKVH